jgi:hypothetical protein
MKRLAIAAAAAGLVATAVVANQPPPTSRADSNANQNAALNPNEVVCQRIQVLGSRLSYGRICKTRAQWAVERQADRMDIEKAQLRLCKPGC